MDLDILPNKTNLGVRFGEDGDLEAYDLATGFCVAYQRRIKVCQIWDDPKADHEMVDVTVRFMCSRPKPKEG